MFDQDFLADLPAPRDDEPPQLRGDIADELADHLHCAHRREMLKDGNDEAARQRVLDRFGDPKKLARRLWWQAMWSRIMGQRLLAGLQWMVSLAAVTLAGAVFWQQMTILQEMRIARQEDAAQRQALTNTLNQLQAQTAKSVHDAALAQSDVELNPPAFSPSNIIPPSDRAVPDRPDADPGTQPEAAKSPPSLIVRLVSESEDGPPVKDAEAHVSNARQSFEAQGFLGPAQVPTIIKHPDGYLRTSFTQVAENAWAFRSLPADRYELKVELPDGQYCTRSLVLREDKPQDVTIVCPAPRKQVPLQITIPPLPAALQAAQVTILCDFFAAPLELAGTKWHAAPWPATRVTFDTRTGQPSSLQIGQNSIGFVEKSSQSPDDLSVFLPIGPIEYHVSATLPRDLEIPSLHFWPRQGTGRQDQATHVVRPEDEHWKMDLPAEFLAELTEGLLADGEKPTPVAERSITKMPGNSVAADASPAKAPTLTLKCVQETADGPPARIQSIQVTDPSGRGEVADSDGPPGSSLFYFPSLQPDRYELEVFMVDGQKLQQAIVIRDETPRKTTIICPPPRKKVPVLITFAPLPGDLQKAGFVVKCRFWSASTVVDQRRWMPGAFAMQDVTFDPQTGQATQIEMNGLNSQQFDLKGTPAEDRTVFLQTGPVIYRFEASQHFDKPSHSDGSFWPNGDDQPLLGTIAAGEDHWKLELPKEYLALLRKRIGNKVSDDPVEPPALPDATNPPAAEAATDQPLGDHCRLILKFTSETKDGETPEGAIVQLVNEQGQRVGSTAPRRGDAPRVAPASNDVTLAPPTAGLCIFEDIEPGRYQLKVSFKDGRYLKEQLPLLRPGQERKEHVVCPPPLKKATIAIQFQPPEDFRRAHITVSHSLRSVPFQLEGRTWEYAPTYVNTLEFDSSTGLLSKVGSISVSQDRPEDRIIIVPSGPYRLVTQIYLDKQLVEFGDALNRGWPPDTNGERGKSTHTAEAGENKWDIKVPDEFWSKARKKLAELEAAK